MYDSDLGGDTCFTCGRRKPGGCKDPATCSTRLAPAADEDPDVFVGLLDSGNPDEMSFDQICHP